jgi:hypothetical protein
VCVCVCVCSSFSMCVCIPLTINTLAGIAPDIVASLKPQVGVDEEMAEGMSCSYRVAYICVFVGGLGDLYESMYVCVCAYVCVLVWGGMFVCMFIYGSKCVFLFNFSLCNCLFTSSSWGCKIVK